MLLCALLSIGILLVTRSPLGSSSPESRHLSVERATASTSTTLANGASPSKHAARGSGHPVRGQSSIGTQLERSASSPSSLPSPALASAFTPGATPSASTTTQPPTTTTTQPPVLPTSATPPHEDIQQGWLEGPTWTSAVYSVDASSPTTISASWTSGALLTLSVSCAKGTTSTSGTSSLSLDADGGACTASLTASASAPMTSYVIDLGAS